jgi:hypothetical protein
MLRTVKRRNGNWIGHMLRRNCLITRVIEGKLEEWEDEEEDISSYWMA